MQPADRSLPDGPAQIDRLVFGYECSAAVLDGRTLFGMPPISLGVLIAVTQC